MGKLYDMLSEDFRFKEGLHTCINCGTCTAICPAAEFYRYDPRKILDTVQRRDEQALEDMLKSDTIWYCGECMSCMTRCPRKNGAGLVIMALRNLAIKTGYYLESERGRQVYPLTKILNGNILKYGYCIYPDSFNYEDHPESGPVTKWRIAHNEEVYKRLGANYKGKGPGVLRDIAPEDLAELKAIFDVSGGTQRMEQVISSSEKKASEMGMTPDEYFRYTFEHSSDKHFNE